MRTIFTKVHSRHAATGVWCLTGLMVMLLGLVGCGVTTVSPPIRVADRSTPTSRSCPPPAAVALPEQHEPALIFVLVDKSGSYAPYTGRAIEALARVLPEAVGPGDRVLISWIGSTSDQPTSVIVDAQLPPLAPIAYPATPTPPVLVTFVPQPTERPNPNLSSMGIVQATATAVAQSTRTALDATVIARENAQFLQEDACARSAWSVQATQLRGVWDAEQRTLRSDFEATVTPALKLAAQTQADKATRISAALLLVSKVFRDERQVHAFQRYRLLLFSDMIEIGASYGEAAKPIDLTGVQVTVGMQACESEVVCQQVEAVWRDRLSEANAEHLTFLRVIQSTDAAIHLQLR
jgi:hypothetical protein